MQKVVYFNEFNIRMGAFSYLPLVSGLLRTYSETFPEIKSAYKSMPFIYHMDEPSKILSQYTEPPDIAAFSSVMWNEQLNYAIARRVKEQYPDCVIVFGGPNVPMPPQHSISDWMLAHPFVDVAVRAEGEEPFADILRRLLESRDFRDIPGVACRDRDGAILFCGVERPFKRELSEYPSPYLLGLYDYLLESGKAEGHQFQAIIETNRGCPFPCTFCYWGRGGLSRKFKFKDLPKVFAEIDWMGRNQIKYVFNADSNFGMNDRDHEIAEFIVATKKKYGSPDKFRTCFGKNTDEKIFQIGALFHANRLEKGITLARQSNDLETLKNIRRNNIKMSTYVNLQQRFNDQDIPVYGELILGLPGETAETWRKGVDELLEAGTKNQLYIYLCQVFANTEMAEDTYRKKFGIVTKRIKLAEIHGQVRPPGFVQEYEDIIVQTNSMPLADWKRSLRFSYVLMLFHSLKIAYYLMIFLLDTFGTKMSEFIEFVSERRFQPGTSPLMEHELAFYDALMERMLVEGEHRGSILPEYSDFYWDVEEASFLRITQDTGGFYRQLRAIVFQFLASKQIACAEKTGMIEEAIVYQQTRIPAQPPGLLGRPATALATELEFGYNFPEYFDNRFNTVPVPLTAKPQWMKVQHRSWATLPDFARESILWGRRSGTMLVEHKYGDKI